MNELLIDCPFKSFKAQNLDQLIQRYAISIPPYVA
jgi:hypothetical protein